VVVPSKARYSHSWAPEKDGETHRREGMTGGNGKKKGGGSERIDAIGVKSVMEEAYRVSFKGHIGRFRKGGNHNQKKPQT